MAEEAIPQDAAPAPESNAARCPWCSAELPSPDVTECPSCLATLVSTADAAVPGVTAIDVEAMLRSGREPARQRGGLLGWISCSGDETPTPSELRSVEAPTADVRREMLRLEIEAERQRLEAEAAAIAAEEQLTNGTPPVAAGDGGASEENDAEPGAAEAVAVPEDEAIAADEDKADS